jgi:menaquinol-cytochrome c reductase iron-sulfur subunit
MLFVPVLSFLFAPLWKKVRQRWQTVARSDRFHSGDTVLVSFEDPSPLPWAGVVARTAAWLRCDDDGHFIAFAVNCTHLGCPVRWEASAELFLCPCHGGVYYKDGQVAGGPPPHALIRYPVRVRDGQVQILTEPIPIM